MYERTSQVDFHLQALQDLLTKIGYLELVDYTWKGIRKYGLNKDKVRKFVGKMNEEWNACFEALWTTIMRLPEYRKKEIRR